MKSIRVFLIAALLSTVSLGIFLAVVQGYRAGTENAQALLDNQLADFAAILGDRGRTAFHDVVPQPSERLAFQIWAVDGELLQRSANA
ncbi:MAG: hypothetical protein ACE5F8_07660, partial [Woeseiaceae bacterium]